MNNGLQAVYAMSPGANLEAYISTVNAIPVLTPEEDLAERFHYQRPGSSASLVISHCALVMPCVATRLRSEPGRPDSGRQRRPDEGGKTF